MLCSPRTDHFDNSLNGVPAPPSPQIPWAAIPGVEAESDEANAFTDCWSANIIETNTTGGAPLDHHPLVINGGWQELP
jgi:hypothetical protein